jgi:catechol 2,3-dioxygenase-like lactoylglutathione lyase family enzyme
MTAMNHIALNCRNVAAQEAFYIKHFGFKRSRTFHPGTPGEFIMLKLGTVRLELFPTDPAKIADEKGGEQAIGFKHLAFDVPKLETAVEALKADGIVTDNIIVVEKIPGLRIVFFRDPEGHILELMEGYYDETP